MKLQDFQYELPSRLIAQEPPPKREASRLMVLDRCSGAIEHNTFLDFSKYLNPGDCLVLNNTRVIPARLLGYREDTGGKIEFVLLRRTDSDFWSVMVKPGRRAKIGDSFIFGDGLLKAEIMEISDDGNRLVKFEYDGIFEEVLNKVGIVPLPPYINKKLDDPDRYQTVYSQHKGSAAAPTAGFHFTVEFLDSLKAKGINIAYITLHIGLGTFRPVKVENIEEHKMHSEYFEIGSEACRIINSTKENGKRVVCVGTTSCRALEAVANITGSVQPFKGDTDIFIFPGYKFKVVDALITNFHLPGSTLLMLVSAFAGRDFVMRAYNEAVNKEYRFFSFGDAMFVK